jgi:hypothetical protein
LISDVSAGGAGEVLIIKVNLSPACSALKDISVLFGKLSGPRPDWIVKCLSGFNGSQHHNSLTMIGEASTGGANCSQILSPSPWFCLIFIWLFDYVEDLGLLPKCGNQSQELSGVKASISNVFGRDYELQYMGRSPNR